MNDFERFGRTVVRTFFDPVPSNSSVEPIWLLGQQYRSDPVPHSPSLAETSSTNTFAAHAERAEDESWIRTSVDEQERQEVPNGGDSLQYGNWPAPFLDDFESRIWMTYRSGFSAIQKSRDPKATSAMSFRVRMQNLASPGFTSDTGFGCMIRSGQSILANALQILRLGRDWRWQDHREDFRHSEVLALFADDPEAPFSIHRFVEHGAAVCGKFPGEWFGPSAAARCIQDLVNKHQSAGIRVYVSGDGADVYEDKLKQVAVDEDGNWQPTLILVGTRLGIDLINPVYWEALKASLQMPQSLGIAGGRPSASHYFIGVQGHNFFYLDPHTTQPLLPYPSRSHFSFSRSDARQPASIPSTSSVVASSTSSGTFISPSDYTTTDTELLLYSPLHLASCHTRRVRRLQIREMDPSMLLSFLVTSEADYKNWKDGIQSVQGKCIIHAQDQEPAPRGQERESAIDDVESWDEEAI